MISLVLGRRMHKVFSAIFLFFSTLQAGSWTEPSLIDSSAILAKSDVSTCYDSTNNRIFAAWADNATNRPVFSIYSSGSWSSPFFIGNDTLAVNNNVFLCYDSQNDQVFAAWKDTGDNNYPYYSIYSGSSWSTPAAIVGSALGDQVSGDDVFLTYDSTNDRVFATWVGNGRSSPAACIYSGGSWGSRVQISGASFPTHNVYTCFNSSDGTIIATWPTPAASGLLYSVYNGSWGAPATIASSVTTPNVFPTYNSSDQTIIATWISTVTDIHTTVYAIGTRVDANTYSWGSSSAISATTVKGTSQTLFTCYNSTNNEVMTVWANSSSDPVYAIYSGGSWGSTQSLNASSPGVYHDVYLTYGSTDNNIFATFGHIDSQLPFYSIYTGSSLTPPSSLSGQQFTNDFGIQKEYYNQLNWSASLSSDIVSYKIYRDGSLIDTVPSSRLSYQDHNRIPGSSYTYTVYAVNSSGTQSTGISVTLR